MKKLLNIKNILIFSFVVIFGLSCTEDNPLNPTVDFDYSISVTPYSTDTYYADGCTNCTDYNPITFIATLESPSTSVSGKTINFSYSSDDFNHASSPFSNESPSTQSNGKAQVTYDDKGFAGTLTVTASFTESIGFGDSTITATYEVDIHPYYELIDTEKLSIYTSNGADDIIAGDFEGVDVIFKVTDSNNTPLPNVPVLFSKNIEDGTLDPSYEIRTDEGGEASAKIFFPNEDTENTDVVISASITDSNIPDGDENYKLTKSLNIQPPTTPDYSLTLNRISTGTTIYNEVGEDAGTLGYYADGDAKNITYQVILRNHQDAAYNKQINFSWQSIDENNIITDAYFETHSDYITGDFTDGAGILKKHLNDGGQSGVILVTASLIENGSVMASDTSHVKIEPYEIAVGNISGYTEKEVVYSGVNAETLDSVKVFARVQDHQGFALENVKILFDFGDSDGAQFGNFRDGINVVETDAAGLAQVTYEAFPNTEGSENLVIEAQLLNGDNSDPIASIPFIVEKPLFDYCLFMESDGTTNYSDNNLTKTHFKVTLLNVSCEGLEEGVDCCSQTSVIDEGVGMVNIPTSWVDNGEWLQITYENSTTDVPAGEISYESYITNSFGEIEFDFEDNGEAGNISFSIEFTDRYGNSPDPITHELTIHPVEDLVETVQLTSNPTDYVIITDTTTIYETTFTALISDENGASVPNVNVEFFNNWDYGTLSSASCVTAENGTCNIILNSTQTDIGSAEVVACVEFEEIARAVSESNNQLQFSWIEEETTSLKSKSKFKKAKKSNSLKINVDALKNSSSYQLFNSDREVCSSGISDSHTVEYIEEQQYYINQASSIDVWVIAEEVVEDNINVTIIDTIFARALNEHGEGIQNVPIQFEKVTDGFGYISSAEVITDSTGLAKTIYYPNTENYTGTNDTEVVEFSIGINGNDSVTDVSQSITLDMSGNINVELDVEYFNFSPNLSEVSHIMGNETVISVMARNSDGVGMANVPIRFSLSSATAPCQGDDGCENYTTSDDCTGATESCTWDVQPPSGNLSEYLVNTCCNEDTSEDDTQTEADSTAISTPGVAQISYWNSEGLSDKLTAYIQHPLDANTTLFSDEVTITTNIVTDLITWSQLSTVSVTSMDSLYCDSLFATAIDANGNTLADIPITFNLEDDVDGYLTVINGQTGNGGSPASALFCPVQGFVGYCDGSDGCDNYENLDDCSEDASTIGDCSWDNVVNVSVSTSVTGVESSTINMTYLDATPECPECVAELKIEADDYILPSERAGSCTGDAGCTAYTAEEDCEENEDGNSCTWTGEVSTYITATMIDSLGHGPDDNTAIFFEAIQQVPEPDNPDNLIWEDIGSIPEIGYFENDTSKVIFSMENASGLVAIVANSEALTDTLYLQLKSTTPSYIEIFDPYPSNIMVQGGGGQASTNISVAIRDANGSNVDKPYWVKFTIVGNSPTGVHINGEPGVIEVDQLSLNGESSISINAGTTPGTVRIKVELYEDDNGEIGSAVSDVPTEEKNIVTVLTGPPAQGEINYSYVDISNIGGGLYEIPVTVMLWDIHSNPVSDSTNVYFDVRGITDVYDPDATYFHGDKIFWGLDADADSLVYKCVVPEVNADLFDMMCQDGDGVNVVVPDENDPGTDNFGFLWVEQIHPASIEGAAKTGNENSEGESYTGVANTKLRFGSATIFSETIIRAHTLGTGGEELIIDSRASHAGESLVLPLTPDGTLSASANPNAWDFSTLGAPAVVTVTATLMDYYQYFIDDGTLALTAPFGTIISSCNGIDQDGDGITGVCYEDADFDGLFDEDENSLPFYNNCSTCADAGGTWQFADKDISEDISSANCTIQGGTFWGGGTDGDTDANGWCGDGIADDNPTFGVTNPSGQVTWTVRYDVGINVCDDCDDAQNPTCEDRESNVIVQLMDPLSQASDPAIVVISRTDHCNDGL